jgi:glycosyltransferase involved in cell wall biosynthesis
MINLLPSSSGGGLSYVRNLIPLLAGDFARSAEHELVLLLNDFQRRELRDLDGSVRCVEVPRQKNGYLRALWEMHALPRIVRDQNVDVLFTPYQLAPSVKRVRTVTMIRNMEPFLFDKYPYDFKNRVRNSVLRRAGRNSLKSSSRVIAVSEFAASYCREALRIPAERLRTIHHGRDKRFSPTPTGNDEHILAGLGISGDYIFTCGSMLPYRRCELIIDAFNRWQNSADCALVIAGSSTDQTYQSRIAALIARAPAGKKIQWLGQVDIEAMRALYRHSGLFVTATEIEACPNIGIEALSSGCHILSSDNPPLPEIFADAADFFRADDGPGLAALFEDHFSKHRAAGAAGIAPNEKALARAEHFCWETCSEHTFKALTDWSSR